MNQVLEKIKKKDIFILVPLAILSLYRTFGHVLWLVLTGRGLPQSPDGQWYLNYAYSLIGKFAININVDEVLYLGYNLLLTMLLFLFKDPLAVIYFQALMASFSILLVYKIALELFNRRTAILAALGYLYLWEVTLWSTYMLSDSFFVSLLLLCVYLLVGAMESGQSAYKVSFALVSMYMCFFRPSGVVVMAVLIVYILSRIDRETFIRILMKYRWMAGSFLVVSGIGFGALYYRNAFDILIYSIQYNVKLVLYNVYAKGWIYDISSSYDYYFRPNYTVDRYDSLFFSFILNNWDSVGILYFRRAVAFLGTWAWETKVATIGDAIYYGFRLMPLGLFILGTIASIRNGKFGRASVLWLIIAAVFVFCIFLFIDAMYRYRFPAMPFVAMVVAYGADRLISGGSLLAKHCRIKRADEAV